MLKAIEIVHWIIDASQRNKSCVILLINQRINSFSIWDFQRVFCLCFLFSAKIWARVFVSWKSKVKKQKKRKTVLFVVKMQLLHSAKCCCCADLRTGGLILGFLNVFGCIAALSDPKAKNVILACMFDIRLLCAWFAKTQNKEKIFLLILLYRIEISDIFSGHWCGICGLSLWHFCGKYLLLLQTQAPGLSEKIRLFFMPKIQNSIFQTEKNGFHVARCDRVVCGSGSAADFHCFIYNICNCGQKNDCRLFCGWCKGGRYKYQWIVCRCMCCHCYCLPSCCTYVYQSIWIISIFISILILDFISICSAWMAFRFGYLFIVEVNERGCSSKCHVWSLNVEMNQWKMKKSTVLCTRPHLGSINDI